ncbi:MAG: peptidoglycan bridge formation glycyltransferase FemA/FemB family protein [Candidatus Kerfeldbacteria bacterium]|nr:peptidoglycan bridge formation glycyltransferase FemA/FemB family protein [Candidatus Kerfeldbacteria bacterium]
MNTYRIQENLPVDQWEDFLSQQPFAPFLQSAHMEKLHQELHDKTWRIAVMQNDQCVGVCFATLVTARRGWYLYIPYGPVIVPEHMDSLPQLMEYLKEFARKERADLIRCSPFVENTPENQDRFAALGFQKAPMHVLAEHLWLLDLVQDEESLLRGMRKTMRNLIKRAEKDGVTISTSQNPEDIEKFIKVHKETASRHGFTPYTNSYFRAQAKAFLPHDLGMLYFAHFEGKIISAAFIMYYGDSGSYHHGASLSEYNKIPASYLLQWQAIQEAKRRGKRIYNFWGIVPESQYQSRFLKRAHPWIGLSKFKTGFGGREYLLLHCQDLPLTKKYYLTRAIETLRKMKRGY